MKFCEEVEKLQRENEGSVILVKNGIFFVAIGKDAVILNRELDLQLTCMKKELCKVGFLVKNAEKYIEIMKSKEISFKMYIIDVKKGKIEILLENIGKNMKEVKANVNCSKCSRKKDTDEDIIERLREIGK